MIHRLLLFRLLIVLGSLTASSALGEATAQVITPASGQDSRIPPGVRVQIRDRAALQAGKLANLPLRTRRGIILDYVLNAFAQAASLPGFDTELLNPTERQEAQQIVDQLFSPSPTPGPEPQPAPPSPAPAPTPGPAPQPAPPRPPPRRRPLPGPNPSNRWCGSSTTSFRSNPRSLCRSIRGSRSSPSCPPTNGSPSRERSRRGSIPGSEGHGIPGHGEHILAPSGGCQRGARLDRAPGPTLRDGLRGEMARVADTDQRDQAVVQCRESGDRPSRDEQAAERRRVGERHGQGDVERAGSWPWSGGRHCRPPRP